MEAVNGAEIISAFAMRPQARDKWRPTGNHSFGSVTRSGQRGDTLNGGIKLNLESSLFNKTLLSLFEYAENNNEYYYVLHSWATSHVWTLKLSLHLSGI